MSYTEQETLTLGEVVDREGFSALPQMMTSVDLGQLLTDLSKQTTDTLTIASNKVTLSKIPLTQILITKSDGSATYLQCGDADTPAAGEFKVSNRSTGEVTFHSGISGEMVCMYLGVTKDSSGGGAAYNKLNTTTDRR